MEKKETRDDKARKEFREKAYARQLDLARIKMEYITALTDGRYFLARANMIAEQLHSGEILEKIDGCPKSREYMEAEYAITKRSAITKLRAAHFAKQDLFKIYNLKEEDILALQEDYYNGKIIRDNYDDEYRKGNKAEFVNSPENKKG